MKRFYSALFFLFLSQAIFSQINFENGYIIKKGGERVNCFIKNEDWNRSPNSIKYKVSNDSKVQLIDVSDIVEFSIDDKIKYRLISTKIDVSNDKDIKLVPKDLFVKVIVEGISNLFYYYKSDEERFFYSVNDSEIKELISKEYLDKDEKKFNNDYLVKLNEDVKCVAESNFVRIDLKLSSLKDYFKDYNICKNSSNTFVSYRKNIKPKLRLHLGINSSSLDMEFFFTRNDFVDRNISYGNQISPTFGLEGEVILPILNNKISVNGSAFYRSYVSEALNVKTEDVFDVDISSIQVMLGLRYLMYLNDNFKLLIGPDVSFDVLKLSNDFNMVNQESQDVFGGLIGNPAFLSMVVGVEYKRYGLQFRYFFDSDISDKKDLAEFQFKSLSLTGTYRIF